MCPAVPYAASSVLIIDPLTNSADITTITISIGRPSLAWWGGNLGFSETDAWSGGVLAPNGKIYGIPWGDREVLIIDPATNKYDATNLTVPTGSGKWRGGMSELSTKAQRSPEFVLQPFKVQDWPCVILSSRSGQREWLRHESKNQLQHSHD